MKTDPSIYKAYDIRGIVGQNLTEKTVCAIGRVLGSMAIEHNVTSFCVGRDSRLTGSILEKALITGISSTGLRVIDIGAVPTPVVYFSTMYFGNGTGCAVTGSHNPPEYNGLKMMMDGITLSGKEIQSIKARIEENQWESTTALARVDKVDVVPAYIKKALAGIQIERRLKVVCDSGNGIAGPIMLKLLKGLDVEAIPLYCEPDGHFPNHHPDPSKPKNLEDLIAKVKETGADFGFALDGDGDRLGVVTNRGEIIYPDRLMMLFAADILKNHPGAQIIYDVKCSRKLVEWIRDKGGEPVISPTGHSLVKAKLRECRAPFAGEMSGHLFFNDERWTGFDDGMYAALRLLEILSRTVDPSAVLSSLPNAVNTPELQIPMGEGENRAFIERFRAESSFEDASAIINIDGIRVEWNDGFALARASNTTPVIVVRFEGDTTDALTRIVRVFITEMLRVDPSLTLPHELQQI